MSYYWIRFGNFLYWVLWPMLFVYLFRTRRTRVLIVHDDKVLVLKNWLGSGRWSLPGGGVRFNEEPKYGAIREVREETGLSIALGQLRHIGTAKHRENHFYYEFEQFVVELKKLAEPVRRHIEVTEFAWMPIKKLNITNADADTMAVVAAWKANR